MLTVPKGRTSVISGSVGFPSQRLCVTSGNSLCQPTKVGGALWSGMEASSRSEAPMLGLSFRGHTGSFVSLFLGVGVEMKHREEGARMLWGLLRCPRSQPQCRLCVYSKWVSMAGAVAQWKDTHLSHTGPWVRLLTLQRKRKDRKSLGSSLAGECNPGRERWTSARLCFAVSTLAGHFEWCTMVQSYSWLSSWNIG